MMDYPSRNRSDTFQRTEDCGQVLDRGHNLGIIKIATTGQFVGETFANVGEILQLVDLGVVLQQVQGEEALVADPAGQAGLSA